MRVLYVLDEFSERTAGTEGQFLELVAGMRARNAHVSIAVLRGGTALESALPDVPFRVLGLNSLRSSSAVGALWRLVRWARAQGSQVAHLYFNDVSIACPIPLRLAGLPVVVSRRDLGLWYAPENLPLLRLNRWAVAAVVANAEAVKRQVIAQERYPERKVTTIYNAWRDRGVSGDPAGVRSALGIPESARVLLALGNLRPLKRVDDAIRILALVRTQCDDAWLCVVGADRVGKSGSEQHRLQALAVELGVADFIVFAGPREDPWPIVQACDIGLFCSESEGLSNALIEYCAAGKPTVCTDAGGNPEVVVDGLSGFVFPTGDVRHAAECVTRLLRDPALSAKLGLQGRRRVLEEFSVERMLDRHLDLYRTLAGEAHSQVGSGSLAS
jgi:glycosyltransferase involved in cell wall biosynthesis